MALAKLKTETVTYKFKYSSFQHRMNLETLKLLPKSWCMKDISQELISQSLGREEKGYLSK